MWQQIIKSIQEYQSFILVSHINPDCDALGSELALADHLLHLDKQVKILNHDPVPPHFRFLDPQKLAKKFVRSKHIATINNADAIIVLDASGGWKRLGRPGDACKDAPGLKLCIDHHPDPTDFVDWAVVDTEAAATAELIYSLIRAMDGEITPRMATALYAGIMTDTGSFRFPKTSPHTHQMAADLLDLGANPLDVYIQVHEQSSLARVRLKGHVMTSIQLAADGQIAYYTVSQDMLKAFGVKLVELAGFATMGQEIGGVRISIYVFETGEDRIKISLRSDGSVSINQIASEFGGGGHPSAAGATVHGKLEEILDAVVTRVEALLEHESRPESLLADYVDHKDGA